MPEPRNAIEAVTHPDPYPYYRRLREERPLFFDEGLGLWVASSSAIAAEALGHAQLRVRPPAEPVPRALLGTAAGEVFAQLVRMNDGEFHARHKPAVEQAARRWTLQDVTAAARQTAEELASLEDANALLSALPVRTMARLLDVEQGLLDATTDWVIAFTQGIAAGASAEAVAHASEAAAALLAQGTAQGLTTVQAANRIAFMQQSLDATAGLLGTTLLLLTRDPSLEPTPALIAEVARWDAPVQNTRRFAAADLLLAGQRIAQGQGVLVLLAAANRDPAFNPEPDRFLVERPERRSMTFGSAGHACPGTAIATESVAVQVQYMRARGTINTLFSRHCGYRPLANARVPVFERKE